MTFKSFNEYEDLVENYLKYDSIVKPRQIWWKIRPHMDFGTVELRLFDALRSLRNLKLITALSQALVYQSVLDHEKGELIEDLPLEYLNDGLWKAIRFDLDSKLMDTAVGDTVIMRTFIQRMGEYSASALKDFGNDDVLDTLDEILVSGTEAQCQLKEFNKNGFDGLLKYLITSVDYS
tara:strand:+ start:181 stop:714 length:534 start_codon:yes stop_codon:yes gene_type:complete